MMDLKDWIRSEEAHGYSEPELKKVLKKKGYSDLDIEEAFKPMWKPTFAKLLFPTLVVLLFSVSHFANMEYVPEFGDKMCTMVTWFNQGQIISQELDLLDNTSIEFQEKTKEMQEWYTTKAPNIRDEKLLFKAATANIIYGTLLYKLNPLMPIACEARLINEFNSKRCSYYLEKNEYICITGYMAQQEFGIMASMLPENIPPYQKMNTFDFLGNTLLLGIIIYLLICLTEHAFILVKFKHFTEKLMVAGFILVPFLLILFAVPEMIFLLPFILLFLFAMFFKHEKFFVWMFYILGIIAYMAVLVFVYFNIMGSHVI